MDIFTWPLVRAVSVSVGGAPEVGRHPDWGGVDGDMVEPEDDEPGRGRT